MSRKFVLGVGAQKSGTTWLYDTIAKDSGFVPGIRKEYHIWDILDFEYRQPYRRTLEGRKRDLTAPPKELDRIASILRDPATYFDHFDDLIGEGQISADVSPLYSGLSTERLMQIHQGIVARGIDFRCVYFMRDPIKRCFSAFQMHRNKRDKRLAARPKGVRGVARRAKAALAGKRDVVEGVPMDGSTDDAFLSYIASDAAALRTRYDRMLPRIEAAFPTDELFVDLYEDVMGEAGSARLAAFLEIGGVQKARSKRVHSTSYTEAISENAERACFDRFRDTYDFVADRFPAARDLWHGFQKFG